MAVIKDWVFEGTTVPDINSNIDIRVSCESEIVGFDCATLGPASGGPYESPTADIEYAYSAMCQGDTSLNDVIMVVSVIPDFPATQCKAEEFFYDSAIEAENGCGTFSVSVGKGHTCVLTNTVFFEGIPTLSQYGIALMALLMLGVGFVSFRRFS